MRVGLVGAGNVARVHLAAWSRLASVQVVGVHSRDSVRGAMVADELRVPYYQELDTLLRDCAVVDVCVPSGLHASIVVRALQAGRDVVCEKPLVLTMTDAATVEQLANETGRMVRMIHQRRYEPLFLAIKRIIRAGLLGSVVAGYMHLGCYRPDSYYTDIPWHGTELDGGVWFNQGAHLLDLWLWLLGGVESVQGVAKNWLGRGAAPDTEGAILHCITGTVGTIVGTTAAYPGTPAELGLFGTKGTVRVSDDAIVQWSVPTAPPAPIGQTGARGDAYDLAIAPFQAAFADYIRDFSERRGPWVEGVALTYLITSIHRSHATGRVVRLDSGRWHELQQGEL